MPNTSSKTDSPDTSLTPFALRPVAAGSVLGRAVAALTVLGLGMGLVVPKIAGAVFLLLAAVAIVWLEPALTRRRAAPVLAPGDRLLVGAVLAFVGLWLASWAAFGLGPVGADDVGRTLRLLLIVPLYLFLRRVEGLDVALWSGITFGALLAGGHAVLMAMAPAADAWQTRAGGATNPIYFGAIALALALMLLPRAASPTTSTGARLLAALGVFGGLLAAALSGSRGAWLALPPLLLIYAFAVARGQSPLRRFGWPAGMVVAVAALAMVPGVPLGERAWQAFESLTGGNVAAATDTLAIRWELWRVAIDAISERPLLGGGPDAYRQALEAAAAAGTIDPTLLRYEHPHNQYLSALLIGGVPGLLALCALFGVPLLLAARQLTDPDRTGRQLAWCALAAVGVLAIVAIGESIFQRNAGIVWFALLGSLTLARARALEREPD